MKRQGVHQAKLDDYFGKRLRIAAEDEQNDDILVAPTCVTALEMIAEAYADVEDGPEAQEKTVIIADPADIAHDHDYAIVTADDVDYAKPDDIDHNNAYRSRTVQTTQTGNARSRRVQKAQVKKKRMNPAIVEIECTDNLSLFRAICVGMFHYENGGGKWQAAERHVASVWLTHAATRMAVYAGVPRKQTTYELDDVRKIYEYMEKTFPGMYRILIFTPTSHTGTVYNTGNNAKHNICLYHHNGHFDLMKTPQKYFGKKHYCVDCEKTYANQANHTKCDIRCRQCFRIGHGYPCKGDSPQELECPDCHKFFANHDCMDAHKPYSCNAFHRCINCNVHYRTRPRLPNKGHTCDVKFCRRCYREHRKGAGHCTQPAAKRLARMTEGRAEAAV